VTQIGTGWADFIDVFSGGDRVIYGIAADGSLHWYRYVVTQSGVDWFKSIQWQQRSGNVIGAGWHNFKWTFASGKGHIYAVLPAGELLWYRNEDTMGTNAPDGSTGWAPVLAAKSVLAGSASAIL
jgi:hypothetical protein